MSDKKTEAQKYLQEFQMNATRSNLCRLVYWMKRYNLAPNDVNLSDDEFEKLNSLTDINEAIVVLAMFRKHGGSGYVDYLKTMVDKGLVLPEDLGLTKEIYDKLIS